MKDGAAGRGAILSSPNINSLWAGLLIEELVRQEVGLFVIAPGSRSAPLALAVAANEKARYLVHVDERGCAFAALGYARATRRPAAVITTSGTAVANALPAAVEADQDAVPLLLLTADRPPELRETGANQSIRQAGLFAGTVRWHFDMPTPSADLDPAFVLTTAAQAVHRSRHPAGPVHLNLMFRESLGPEPDGTDAPALVSHLGDWLGADRPYTTYRRPDAFLPSDYLERLAAIQRGVVVVGKTDDPGLAEPAAGLAEALAWPLLPDIGSGLRLGASEGSAVSYYDIALASGELSSIRPDAVIHLAGPVVSKRLLTWIADSRPRDVIVVREDPARFDPAHVVTERIHADPAAWARELVRGSAPRPSTDWLEKWRAVSAQAGAVLDNNLGAALSEPNVARSVASSIPEGGALVLGSSMPIRDADSFARPDGPAVRVAANRGASGIDGTVATAAGFALGAGVPTALLLGDLALLHDLNGLDLLRRPEMPPVVVVVINNDGGGIFSFLPIAEADGVPFETLFGTPHGLHFEHAAGMYGLGYSRPRAAEELSNAMRAAFDAGRPAILEINTDRASNRALHAQILGRVAAGVDGVLQERV